MKTIPACEAFLLAATVTLAGLLAHGQTDVASSLYGAFSGSTTTANTSKVQVDAPPSPVECGGASGPDLEGTWPNQSCHRRRALPGTEGSCILSML